jgi:hypothetical protein
MLVYFAAPTAATAAKDLEGIIKQHFNPIIYITFISKTQHLF